MGNTLLLLASLFFMYTSGENCDKLGVTLYEDLGCKPQNVQGKPCPTYFECEDFAKSNQTCNFRSQNIRVGERFKYDGKYSSCNKVDCQCVFNEDRNMAEFKCGNLYCREWTDGDYTWPPECYLTYIMGECCAIGYACPPYDNKTKCVVDGNVYREGEIFYPPNTCLSCLCQEGFNGTFEAPFCRRTLCDVQIDHSDELAKNCAPVYLHGEALCCPSEWACPSDTDKIKQIANGTDSNSDLNCKWGNRQLKLGEGLETTIKYSNIAKNVTCECALPPLLTCKETKK